LSGWLIGDGLELAALQRKARQIGLPEDALHFLGAREDVPALLAQMHILMLTSDHEGFPNAILEGMAARLPVIATPAGDSADLVQHSQGGFVVGFNDLTEMAGRIIQLAQDARLRARMGADGRRYVEQAYSVERLPANLARLYRAVADHFPRTGLSAALAGSELHG
jgi:glycosyltransferase involved in cell wall biosynthesis